MTCMGDRFDHMILSRLQRTTGWDTTKDWAQHPCHGLQFTLIYQPALPVLAA